MNVSTRFIFIFSVFLLSTTMFNPGWVLASDKESADKAGQNFQPSSDSMSAVTATLDIARGNNKLMLVVMGANWCHDSRALASRLNKEPLRSLVNEHYETIFVDVGYLDKGKDVITSLGSPVYYATPTILIVDPVSGRLVNEHNRHQWGNADKISMEDSVGYFQLMVNTDLEALREDIQLSNELQALLTEIDAFEQVQADRLYQAYAVLAPMLEAMDKGDRAGFSDKYWNKVRDFRMKVPNDIEALRAEAYTRAAAGENNIKLKYPKYPAFPWEKKKTPGSRGLLSGWRTNVSQVQQMFRNVTWPGIGPIAEWS
jgi:hypothetical protein